MLECLIREIAQTGYTPEHLKQIDFALKVFPEITKPLVLDNLVFNAEAEPVSFYPDSEEFTEYNCSLLFYACLNYDIKLFNFLIAKGADPTGIHLQTIGDYEQYTVLDFLIKCPDLLFAQKALYSVNIPIDHMEVMINKCIYYDYVDTFKVLYELYPFSIKPLIAKVSVQSQIGWYLRELGHVHLSNLLCLETTQIRCPICYEDTENAARLLCGHLFCEDCITKWLDIHLACPMCRQQFT